MKYNIQLPFSGFYESIWSHSDEISNEIYIINTERNHNGLKDLKFTNWDLEYDNKTREHDICVEYTRQMYRKYYSKYVSSMVFSEVTYPREYNFTTNQIFADIEISNNSIRLLKEYIYANKEDFEYWIRKRFTSCSGYISFVHNNWNEWVTETSDFTKYNDMYLGIVLEWAVDPESEYDIYEDMSGYDILSYAYLSWSALTTEADEDLLRIGQLEAMYTAELQGKSVVEAQKWCDSSDYNLGIKLRVLHQYLKTLG